MTLRSLVIGAVVAALSLGTPVVSPAAAGPGSGFPTASDVKAVVGGQGGWRVHPGDIATVGGRPGRCRSDRQLGDVDTVRARYFSGRERGVPRSVYTGAEVAVLSYADVAAARAAVRTHASYPRRCPKVTEWVCEDCDGIATTWRTRTPAARVGDQSVAWSFRAVGNAKSVGYAVVARRGATVVRVTLIRTRDMVADAGWRYPRLMPKREAVRLARTALAAVS